MVCNALLCRDLLYLNLLRLHMLLCMHVEMLVCMYLFVRVCVCVCTCTSHSKLFFVRDYTHYSAVNMVIYPYNNIYHSVASTVCQLPIRGVSPAAVREVHDVFVSYSCHDYVIVISYHMYIMFMPYLHHTYPLIYLYSCNIF